jgi:hypothetical protein
MKHIAVCTDGGLRMMEDFDPKDSSDVGVGILKDVEEVLVVTRAYRRKMVWEVVPVADVVALAGAASVAEVGGPPEVEPDLEV